MAKFDVVDDEEFAAFVNQVSEEQKEQLERKSRGSSGTYTPEEIKWVGLPENKMEIVRLVGRPPRGTANQTTYDMHEIFTSELKDDDGKVMKLNLPVREDISEKDHLMWRIIDSVMRVTWVKDSKGKSQKVYENELKYPDVFAKVAKAGFDPEKDKNKYKWTRGWAGQKVLIANAIVRSASKWHKENKHTVLLSKNVNTSEDGTKEYPFVGIASYGFVELLSDISGKYGPLEKYDLGITRTGVMNSPYKMINASRMVEANFLDEVDKDIQNLIVVGPLTDEELDYDRYEIGRLFKPTPYGKIKRRLGKTIKSIDSALRTNYYDELTKLAEAEAEEAKANAPEGQTTNSVPLVETKEAVKEEAKPAVTRQTRTAPVVEAAKASDKDFSKILKGWNDLTDVEKSRVLDVEVDADGKVSNILYEITDASDFEVGCTNKECQIGAPQSFGHCPACGLKF